MMRASRFHVAGHRVLAIYLVALACACGAEEQLPTATTEIGVFYGGQVQRSQKVIVSSIRPPKIGFRVTFPPKEKGVADQAGGRKVHYELTRPGPAGRRVTAKDILVASPDHQRLDHVFELEGAPRLGVWNVRVTLDGRVLADRALYLVAPR